jgi:hypothetical protein
MHCFNLPIFSARVTGAMESFQALLDFYSLFRAPSSFRKDVRNLVHVLVSVQPLTTGKRGHYMNVLGRSPAARCQMAALS